MTARNQRNSIVLGEKGTGEFSVTIRRGLNDGSDEYTRKYVEYVCHGVVDLDIDDPYQIGGGELSLIRVSFSSGGHEHIHGVICEVETDE